MELLLHIISWLVFLYLGACTGYILVAAIAGKLYPKQIQPSSDHKLPIAILIPAYKDDNVIIHTAKAAANQSYPSDRFHVFVLADQLQPHTCTQLSQIPGVTVMNMQFDLSTKAKSLLHALSRLDAARFPITLILDADNIMSDGCLDQINTRFLGGAKAVQCHRTAKNTHTTVALLDGISEEINNTIFRAGQRFFGQPSAIIGSGMAFDTSLIRDILMKPGLVDNPGEDREIDVSLLELGVDIEFLKGVYVYDEKVPNTAVFQKQRVRWLEAQVSHAKLLLSPRFAQQRNKPFYLNKLFQTWMLPRLLIIGLYGLVGMLIIISYVFKWNFFVPDQKWWIGLIVVYFAALILSIPSQFMNGKTLKAIFKIPALLFAMLRSLLQMKTGRREFLHTPKGFGT